jgi:hypothetical protein
MSLECAVLRKGVGMHWRYAGEKIWCALPWKPHKCGDFLHVQSVQMKSIQNKIIISQKTFIIHIIILYLSILLHLYTLHIH